MRRIFLGMMAGLLVVSGTFGGPAAGGDWWAAVDASPSLDPILGPGADALWSIKGGIAPKDGGPYRIEHDPILARPVLVCRERWFTLSSRTVFSECEITCRVRLAASPARKSVAFNIATAVDPADPKDRGLSVRIVGGQSGPFILDVVGKRIGFKHHAYDKIMPTWTDAIRIPIEKDMGELPAGPDKWLQVRFRITADLFHIWLDDRLVAARDMGDLKPAGLVRLTLKPGVRIADFTVRPITGQASPYEPIRLAGYVHDRALAGESGLADGALPFGQTVAVEGIPFHFTARRGDNCPDHIDVGRSLVRQGNMEGYFPSSGHRFVGALTVDPARIQLRVPNGRYNAMYVVAGFDDQKNSIPVLSASFYRSSAGFPQVFEATVPSIHAKSNDGAKALPVRLENGRVVNLWLIKIPLDPARLASFSDMDILELELSKRVRQYRSYPDPYIYGWHAAGLPSGVHVYAVTLQRPDLHMTLDPTQFGHVWTAPQRPAYVVKVSNRTGQTRDIVLTAETRSRDGQETLKQEKKLRVAADRELAHTFAFTVKKNGCHAITVTMRDADRTWIEERSFVRLHSDTRTPYWKEGEGPFFGYWSYHGGHHTPPATNIMTVMQAAGARGPMRSHIPEIQALADKWQWRAVANAWPVSPQWAWAGEEKLDAEKVKTYKEKVMSAFRKVQGDNPEFVTLFPEPHVSRDLTAGNPPDYWGEPAYEMNDHEQRTFRVMWNTAKVASEAVRKAWPNTKILFPWGDPLFIVPFLRRGYPKELIDGSGLDMIGFERLPEQQIHQQSVHRLYILKEEYRRYGMPDPELYYVEGAFVPTEPGACTWQEQAERYHRWTLISLAYGIERFYSGWFAYDCGNYYGAEHYGGCGIQRRIPYSDPKPAYAHYATMTRMLNQATFDRWLPTGSHTVFCLKFDRKVRDPVYAMWTVRGTRPVLLTVDKDAALTVTDSMDNSVLVKPEKGVAVITVGTSPIYVSMPCEIADISLGEPDHTGTVEWTRLRNQKTWHSGPVVRSAPVAKDISLANLGDGSWVLVDEHDDLYENNNYDTRRFLGRMTAAVVTNADLPGSFLSVHLAKQVKERQLMPWYSVLKPRRPIVIPGKACALGMWVKAHSDWGRIVYSLTDAKGERWISVGTKDQWNCNDVHGWSMFNFDGWRYLRFELPGNSDYDSFREYGSTWWGHVGGDGIVDLPVTLDKIIVERRTHVVYVNDVQPADPADVLLGELVAEYETAFDCTKDAVKLNRLRMSLPSGKFRLANPIADMVRENELEPVALKEVTMPDWGYDGTVGHVHFAEAPDAIQYQVWVAAYPDGRGATVLGKLKESGGRVRGFRPAMKLYLWVTYTRKVGEGKAKKVIASKPSNMLEIQLIDAFGMK